MAEMQMRTDEFVRYMTHLSRLPEASPLVTETLAELGLAERDGLSGQEMVAVERAVLAKVDQALASHPNPAAQRFARLMAHANAVVNRRLSAE